MLHFGLIVLVVAGAVVVVIGIAHGITRDFRRMDRQ